MSKSQRCFASETSLSSRLLKRLSAEDFEDDAFSHPQTALAALRLRRTQERVSGYAAVRRTWAGVEGSSLGLRVLAGKSQHVAHTNHHLNDGCNQSQFPARVPMQSLETG